MGSYDLIRRTVEKLPFQIDYYSRGRFKTNNLYGVEPIRIIIDGLSEKAYHHEFRFTMLNKDEYVITLEGEQKSGIYDNWECKGVYGELIENQFFVGTIVKLYSLDNNISFLFRFRDLGSLENEFASRLALSYVGEQSSVVGMSLVGNVTQRDKDFLNALANEFISVDLENKNMEAVRTIDFIDEQLSNLSDSLQSSEMRLRQYRREHNIIDVNSYTSGIYSKMTTLDNKRSELKLKDAYFKQLSDYIKGNLKSDGLVAPSSLGVADPVLLNLVQQYNDLQVERSNIGEKNPKYVLLTKQIDDVRQTLLEVIDNVRKVQDLERNSFEREYSSTISDVKDLPVKELAMVNYERDYKINDNYYTFLLQKRSEAQIRKASNISDNKILQTARVQRVVNGGTKSKTYMMYGIIGLIIPALLIILRTLLNFTIRNEADINKLTKYSVIGNIRHTRSKALVVTRAHPKSLFAECFRIVRTRIEFIAKRKSKISVMITSAESGDGKSFFCINLGGIYSLVSRKVLLIDLDLRNPRLSNMIDKSIDRGLVNYLIGDCTLEEAIIKRDDLGFDLLPVGVIPPNPAELLRSKELKELLEEVKEMYDYVVIDTSPLGLVADSYALAHQVDVNLLLVRSGKTNKNFFKSFVQQVYQDGILNFYVILNDVPIPKSGSGAYGYGYTSYGHNSKYYQNNKYYVDDIDEDKK